MATDGKIDRPIFLKFFLAAATALVTLELLMAAMAGLQLLPFFVCAIAFLFLIARFALTGFGPSVDGGRFLAIVLLLKVTAVLVGVTGGVASPCSGLLFLPVFIAALYFGLRGGILTSAMICIFLCVLTLWDGDYSRRTVLPLLTQCGVFVIVSVSAGAFVSQARRTATKASRRASVSAARADKVEWFTDTAVMMESLYETGNMLSVALLRLEELVKCDTAAFFLRDSDDMRLVLAQTLGIRVDQTRLKSIPLGRRDKFRDPAYGGIFLPDAMPADPDLEAFARFDPEARSVVVVPLRTFDELVGAIYVGSHTPGTFTARNRENIVEFARHVIYPIQRVRLQTMASTDALTGLNNRRALRDRLREEVERASRYSNPLSLIMIDIDNFKRINDTHGHRAGDAILMQIGAVLLKVSRITDFAARYGGEEMAILCPETTGADAHAFAERIRAAVAASEFDLQNGQKVRITVSAGVGILRLGEKSETPLVESADRALYEAKARGRNRVVLSGI